MTPFTFIVASLAIWRLSHGIVKEDGPLMVWARLRARLARTQRRSGGLFDMVSCVRCLSFWIGLVGALFVSNSILGWIAYAFAFSAVASLLDALFNKLNTLSVVTRPTTDNKISVSRGPTPEQRDNVVSNPRTTDGSIAVKAFSTLNN